MKILVTTVSGSMYKLDQEAMTFERANDDPSKNGGMWDAPQIKGKLTSWPSIVVGQGMRLWVHIEYPEVGQPNTWIDTTAVASIENL